MKYLITGGSGKLGSELVKLFPNSLSPSHDNMKIEDVNSVNNYFEENIFDTIIHTAALTSVRKCEEDRKTAWEVNVKGTQNLLSAAKKFNPDCYFIYISTACVFRGDEANYTESSIPYPKNFYALTKLISEIMVQNSGIISWLIIRSNFVSKEKWPYEKAFTDRYGNYLYSEDLAKAIKLMIEFKKKEIIHIHGSKIYSMYEIAKLKNPDIIPMTIAEYSGPLLTMNMTLKSEKISEFNISE